MRDEPRFDGCGFTVAEHEALKADPQRWATEMVGHRRCHQTALEFAEHHCGSTLCVIYDHDLLAQIEADAEIRWALARSARAVSRPSQPPPVASGDQLAAVAS